MPFKRGFDLLKQKRYTEASAYFISRFQDEFAQLPFDIKRYNSCLYGQARALIGLEEYLLAGEILHDLMLREPDWEAPRITFARVCEKLGLPNEAERVYSHAIIANPNSEKLREHYLWFLKENLEEDGVNYKKSATFTPAFTATMQTQVNSAQLSIAAEAEMLSEETKTSCPPNR